MPICGAQKVEAVRFQPVSHSCQSHRKLRKTEPPKKRSTRCDQRRGKHAFNASVPQVVGRKASVVEPVMGDSLKSGIRHQRGDDQKSQNRQCKWQAAITTWNLR